MTQELQSAENVSEPAVFRSGLPAVNRIPQGSRDALRPRSGLAAMPQGREVAEVLGPLAMSDASESSPAVEFEAGRHSLHERLARIRAETSCVAARADSWMARLKAEQIEQAETARALRAGGLKARLAAVCARYRLPSEDR